MMTDICPICLEFCTNSNKSVTHCCHHEFHTSYVKMMLTDNCPLCRQPMQINLKTQDTIREQTIQLTIQLIYQASVPRFIDCSHCSYSAIFENIDGLTPEYICYVCGESFYVFNSPLDFCELRDYLLYEIRGIKFRTLQHYLLYFNIHTHHTIPDIYNDLKTVNCGRHDYLLYKLAPHIFL
jgi:hypothetical protein